MTLTQRTEDIIRVLIRFPQDKPVTISIISDELNLSTRSVQRELPFVEQWLTSNGFSLVRKRSVGLYLDESDNRRQELLSLLENGNSAVTGNDDRRLRQDYICHDILFAAEPLKFYYFTSKFGISEGTLASDLSKLEAWFEKYNLKLIRKPGLGVYIKGNEIARRQALTSFFCYQMSQMNDRSHIRNSELNLLNDAFGENTEEIISGIRGIILDTEKTLSLKLSDNGYLHLLIYLAYSVYRMQGDHYIQLPEDSDTDISAEPEYAVADHLLQQIRRKFPISRNQDETVYLVTYLSGTRIWPSERRDLTQKRDFDIHEMTLAFIRNVGEFMNKDFHRDHKLPEELAGHLQPTIGRLRAGIPIENPLLEDFQSNYKDVFEACEAAAEVISGMYELPQFSLSEIGYITVYFVMALERSRSLAKQLTVVLVCPTGFGSSRLLASSLATEYPNLEIRGIMSAYDICEEELEKSGIDLIISTVKLNTSFKWICVTPMLSKQDKMLLDSRIGVLINQKKTLDAPAVIPASSFGKKEIDYIAELGEEIYKLLDNVRIGSAPVLRNRSEVISYAATLFAESEESEQALFNVLKERDDLADTYMKPFHALLLHGKTDEVEHPCFGYVKLDPPIYENTHIIMGAIVSLIPDGPRNQVASSIVSDIVGALLANEKMLKALREADEDLFVQMLEKSLLKFYKSCVQTSLA